MVRCAKLWKIQEARLLGTCTAHLHSGFSHLHGYLGLHGYSELKSSRAGTGTRKPENPTRNCHYPTRPEQEILASGKTRPDPKPDTKPAGTRLWKKDTISTTISQKKT